jgi:Sigma-70 region 2
MTDRDEERGPMDEHDWLAERFEENRPHLRAVAYRVLGSASEADDAVQEAWLRFSRAGAGEVENLGGWLTTIVARVSLNIVLRDLSGEVRGAAAVAATFSGRAVGARLALIDGVPGMMWAQGGKIRVVFDFTIVGGTIAAIEMIADPEHLTQLDIVPTRRGGSTA